MKKCFYGSKTNEPYAVYRGEQPLYGAKNEISGIGSITYMTAGLPVQISEIKGNMVQNRTPSPDNPVEVKGVGERTANLLTNYTRGLWYNGNDNIFIPDSTKSAYVVPIKPGTTYTVKKIAPANRLVVFTASTYPEPQVAIFRTIITNFTTNTTVKTFTAEEGDNYLFVGFYNGTNESEIEEAKKSVMLNEGSTALLYEPYGYKIPVINVGKNLIDESKLVYRYHLDATTGLPAEYKSTNSDRWAILKPFAIAPSKTYIISFNSKTIGFYAMYSVFDKSNQLVRRVVGIRSGTALDVSGGEYIYVSLYFGNNGTREGFWDVQLEESDTATPYEPYTATTNNIYLDEPLYGNTSNMDVIGVGGVTKRWGVKVLDGTEEIKDGWFSIRGRIEVACNFGLKEARRYESFCTHYPYSPKTEVEFDKNKFYVYPDRFCFYPSGTEGITQDNPVETTQAYFASEYAKGTPVTVYYPLATPTTAPATLPVISAGKGTYTVTTDTAVKPNGIKITASGKDINNLFPYPYKSNEKDSKGLSFRLDRRTVTIVGTCEGDVTFQFYGTWGSTDTLDLVQGKRYFITGVDKYMKLRFFDSSGSAVLGINGTDKEFTVPTTAVGAAYYWQCSTVGDVIDTVITPQFYLKG